MKSKTLSSLCELRGLRGEENYVSVNAYAEGRTRTDTNLTVPRILSPVRLPISPPRREFTAEHAENAEYKNYFLLFSAASAYSAVISKRRRADSNRGIKVLQTSALPLGYAAKH